MGTLITGSRPWRSVAAGRAVLERRLGLCETGGQMDTPELLRAQWFAIAKGVVSRAASILTYSNALSLLRVSRAAAGSNGLATPHRLRDRAPGAPPPRCNRPAASTSCPSSPPPWPCVTTTRQQQQEQPPLLVPACCNGPPPPPPSLAAAASPASTASMPLAPPSHARLRLPPLPPSQGWAWPPPRPQAQAHLRPTSSLRTTTAMHTAAANWTTPPTPPTNRPWLRISVCPAHTPTATPPGVRPKEACPPPPSMPLGPAPGPLPAARRTCQVLWDLP